jgi:hypothetical protein
MAGQPDPTWVPHAPDTAPAHDTNIAFFGVHSPSPHRSARAAVMPPVRWFDGVPVSSVARLLAGRRADAVAIIDVQEGVRSRQQVRHLTWAQQRAKVQALDPQAKSRWKFSATITSPRGTS